MSHFWKTLPLAVLCVAAIASVAAADGLNIDEDFTFQGEYVGTIALDGQNWQVAGLQVVALGGGKFDAVLYRGGLPGAGWDRVTKHALHGQRDGSQVTLAGDQQHVTVASDGSATHWSDERLTPALIAGQSKVGFLRKIQRRSPTMSAPPPRGATVLFDGSDTSNLEGAKVTDDGLLQVGATTKDPVGDFRLHLEFRTPYQPASRGQGRGNSGVYIQRRYEVQILDSFGLEGAFNECGALYRQRPPDLNMCLPPLSWQTYDIDFTAARFDAAGTKSANGRITVALNGVVVQNDVAITGQTGAGQPEGPEMLPILFQNHNNPVHFRNLWIVSGSPAVAQAAATTTSTCEVQYQQIPSRCSHGCRLSKSVCGRRFAFCRRKR